MAVSRHQRFFVRLLLATTTFTLSALCVKAFVNDGSVKQKLNKEIVHGERTDIGNTIPNLHSDSSISQFAVSHTSFLSHPLLEGNEQDADTGLKVVTMKEVMEKCGACHTVNENLTIRDSTHVLNTRLRTPREVWGEELNLQLKCGTCHTVPVPEEISMRRWPEVINHMRQVFSIKDWPVEYTQAEWLDVLHYYIAGSVEFEDLPPDPPVSGFRFVPRNAGLLPGPNIGTKVGNVSIVDLDQDGQPDILATDFDMNALVWIYPTKDGWREQTLAAATFPAKAEVFDFNDDGHLDIVLAALGSMLPTNDSVGSAWLLINDGTMKFTPTKLIDKMGRFSDIRPADMDNDGDWDFVTSAFGFLTIGEVGWLEQTEDGTFEYHRLSPKAGGIHVIPTDLNDDGLMDIMALIAQEHEEIIGFVNQGDGSFKQELLYKAFTPAFGSSGIELVDLDGDGDEDILYTNGDAVDLPTPMVLPYHGVQWLERKGELEYEYHPIFSFYGAYRAVPGDLDDDGDLDIVAVTMVTDWGDPNRLSAIWLENDGTQQFTPHGIGNTPINLITVDIGDLDGDGDLDLVTGGMNVFALIPYRMGRVTVWTNEGTIPDLKK